MPFGLVRLISTAWLALKSGAHLGLAMYASLRAGAPVVWEHVVAISAGDLERNRRGDHGIASVCQNRRTKIWSRSDAMLAISTLFSASATMTVNVASAGLAKIRSTGRQCPVLFQQTSVPPDLMNTTPSVSATSTAPCILPIAARALVTFRLGRT